MLFGFTMQKCLAPEKQSHSEESGIRSVSIIMRGHSVRKGGVAGGRRHVAGARGQGAGCCGLVTNPVKVCVSERVCVCV